MKAWILLPTVVYGALIALAVGAGKKTAIHPFVSDCEGKESKHAVCLFGCAMVSGRKVVVNAGFRSQSRSCVYFGD